MVFDEFDDIFDLRFGPFHMGVFSRPFKASYSRTSENHIIKLKLREDIERKDIKVRLLEGGILEVEWPRKKKGEEIPVE